jgi:carbonic anhydrase
MTKEQTKKHLTREKRLRHEERELRIKKRSREKKKHKRDKKATEESIMKQIESIKFSSVIISDDFSLFSFKTIAILQYTYIHIS